MSGRVGRIWKGLLPQFGGGKRGAELDVSEKVPSRPMNPRFGDNATGFERGRIIVQMVEDGTEYLWWERRHHGSNGPTQRVRRRY